MHEMPVTFHKHLYSFCLAAGFPWMPPLVLEGQRVPERFRGMAVRLPDGACPMSPTAVRHHAALERAPLETPVRRQGALGSYASRIKFVSLCLCICAKNFLNTKRLDVYPSRSLLQNAGQGKVCGHSLQRANSCPLSSTGNTS